MKKYSTVAILLISATSLAHAENVHCHVYRYDNSSGQKFSCGDASFDAANPMSWTAQFPACSSDMGMIILNNQAEIWVRHLKPNLFKPMNEWRPDQVGSLSWRPGTLMNDFAVTCSGGGRYEYIADCEKL